MLQKVGVLKKIWDVEAGKCRRHWFSSIKGSFRVVPYHYFAVLTPGSFSIGPLPPGQGPLHHAKKIVNSSEFMIHLAKACSVGMGQHGLLLGVFLGGELGPESDFPLHAAWEENGGPQQFYVPRPDLSRCVTLYLSKQ